MPGGYCWSRVRCYGWSVSPALIVILVTAFYLLLLFTNDQIEDALLGATQDWSGLGGFLDRRTLGLCLWTLVLALAAWFWARLLIGLQRPLPAGLPPPFNLPANRAAIDRALHPGGLWLPRLLGALAPFATALAIWRAGAAADGPNYSAGIALALLCATALFLSVVIIRRPAAVALATWWATWPRLAAALTPAPGHATAVYASFRDVPVLPLVVALASAALGLAMTVAALINPVGTGQFFGPLLIIPLGLTGIISGLSLIAFLTQEFRFPLVVALIALAVVSSSLADNHVLRPAAVMSNAAPRAAASDIDHALPKFVAAAGPQPRLLIVATAGGGIRAAFWTAYVLGRLHDELHDTFDRSLFAISGVSGGSYGAVVYRAMLRAAQVTGGDPPCREPTGAALARANAVRRLMPPTPGSFANCVPVFLLPDGLGPTLVSALYPDLEQRLLPVAIFPDRAVALEQSWQAAWRDGAAGKTGELLAGPFDQLWAADQFFPVLLLNGTSVLGGRRIITSNLTLANVNSPYAKDFADAYDFGALTPLRIAASTAASNSARFPYVSPPGTIPGPDGNPVDQIVDGGVFENSGAATALDLYEWLLINAKEFTPGHIGVLQITSDPDLNDPTGRCGAAAAPPGAMQFAADELSAPTALLHTREARGAAAVQALQARVRASTYDPQDPHKPPPYFSLRLSRQDARQMAPLGWTLSLAAAESLVQAWPAKDAPTHCNFNDRNRLVNWLNGKAAD